MQGNDRSKLILACRDYISQRVAVIKKAMNGLKEDLEGESKSSAGDKFETGREMINIEWNKLSVQLSQYDHLDQILNRLEDHIPTEMIVLGSMVYTDAANYFISIPAGEISGGSDKFYAIGIQAPIAQLMLGKKVGDSINFNGRQFKVQRIS
ncbi:MAG: transcription elongation factor [Christiangramia sp.]|nr:transcription elongation factor [Christiangramia sp.]